MLIRDARPDEAGELTELALRSKAHWGYDEAFMASCREELTVRPSEVGSGAPPSPSATAASSASRRWTAARRRARWA